MTTTNESKRDKIILLAILILSSLFVLGCSIKGDEPKHEDVKYEFSVGKYVVSSSSYDYMIYAAVNQETGEGYIIDSKGNKINGSGFTRPINYADGSFWVADGFYRIKDNEYTAGTYSLKLNCWDNLIEKYLNWDGIPDWKNIPNIEYTANNRTVFVNKIPGITETELSKKLSVRYRLKLYASGYQTAKLFGQSESTKDTSFISYYLPRKTTEQTISLVPVLVAELYNEKGIQMIIYYAGSEFKY